MSNRYLAAAFAAFGLSLSAAAVAEVENRAIEEKRLASGRQTLAPDKGYIFLHGPYSRGVVLIKEPTAEELVAFRAEWQAEFDEAERRFPRLLAYWRKDLQLGTQDMSDRPVRPTPETFSIGRIETRMIVNVGSSDAFSRGDDTFSYLHELEPGTYRYYGPITVTPNGAVTGTCACMGSVKFEVKAGAITNLGDFFVQTLSAVALEGPGLSPDNTSGVTDYVLPPRLAAFPNQQAEWRAAGKMDNLYRIMVGRMPPIPGVLAYDRDRVIDLKADQAAAAGAL